MTIDIGKNVISGPSEVEMVRAAGDTGANMTRNLAIAIIAGRSPLTGSRASFRLPLQGKGRYALDRGHFKGPKLMEQAIKVTERIADSLIRQVVTIDDSVYESHLEDCLQPH